METESMKTALKKELLVELKRVDPRLRAELASDVEEVFNSILCAMDRGDMPRAATDEVCQLMKALEVKYLL